MYTALARSRPRQVYKGELDGMTVAIKVSSSEDVAPHSFRRHDTCPARRSAAPKPDDGVTCEDLASSL